MNTKKQNNNCIYSKICRVTWYCFSRENCKGCKYVFRIFWLKIKNQGLQKETQWNWSSNFRIEGNRMAHMAN